MSAAESTTPTTSAAADGKAAPATAAIYDLGYKRYVGNRVAASSRWRVIMRNQLSTAWKGWWRLKFPLGTALMISLVAGAVMYV